MSRQVERQWLDWWTRGFWQHADASWCHLPFFQLDPLHQQRLAYAHHNAFAQHLNLPDTLPGPPDERLLALSEAPEPQRRLMLRLVGEICQHDSGAEALDAAQRTWCHRITRALRPGIWLPPELHFSPDPQPAALALLAPLFSPENWLRLRLGFDYQLVKQLPELPDALPLNKLQALWEAVIWRSQQQDGQPHVDN
ncbi:type III secretion protein HrpD [Paramixta manurensis]|uniref:Type III secretion protein HrpD n=1 Tax=Paramixta manurensis TaxID=2740817 RepID=A0A6M8UCS8_9GAMM|nr:type III secretion protein HrpD [Erwiniaceae bacterium PD-1]